MEIITTYPITYSVNVRFDVLVLRKSPSLHKLQISATMETKACSHQMSHLVNSYPSLQLMQFELLPILNRQNGS